MMNWDEKNLFFGVEPGCPAHGDPWMKACRLCGAEFCERCHPENHVCADCVVTVDEDADRAADEWAE